MPTDPVWTEALLRDPHKVADKASRVRSMFNSVARQYQRTNALCSLGRDARWRARTVQVAEIRADDDVLDIACGTGDLTRAFAQARPHSVIGCDFAHQMLAIAAASSGASCLWAEADALRLPFSDESFSVVSCAFGVRNFDDLDFGLREMRRVLRPGGRVVILEFARPRIALIRWSYECYANRIMPWLATWISGDRTGAYRYLPRSVVSFPGAQQMCRQLEACGFINAKAIELTFGVAVVYRAQKEECR